MLEIRPPSPGSAVTWIILWLATLIALAFVPVDRPGKDVASAADNARYSYDAPLFDEDHEPIDQDATFGVGGS